MNAKHEHAFWGVLSQDGMEKLGEIFPNKIVPLRSIMSNSAVLEGKESESRQIYKIDISALSDEQFEKIIDFLVNGEQERSHIDYTTVAEEVKKMGFVPIQAKYISGVGTDRVELFL